MLVPIFEKLEIVGFRYFERHDVVREYAVWRVEGASRLRKLSAHLPQMLVTCVQDGVARGYIYLPQQVLGSSKAFFL